MIDRDFRYGHYEPDRQHVAYAREYRNYTGRDVWVQDGQGHVVRVPPSTPEPNYRRHCIFLVRTYGMWDRNYIHPALTDVTAPMGGHHWSRLTEQSPHRHNACLVTNVEVWEERLAGNRGVYLEAEDVYVSHHVIDRDNHHPKQGPNGGAYDLFGKDLGVGLYVELVSSEPRTEPLYMPFMGGVQKIPITIHSGSNEDGLVVYTKRPHQTEPERNVYSLDQFMSGEGHLGIRLYRTEAEAIHDDNNPQRRALTEEEEQFRKNREKALAKAKEEGRQAAVAEVVAQRKIVEEKERKLEEKAIALHEKRRSDKTGFWASIAKGFTTAVSFLKSLIF